MLRTPLLAAMALIGGALVVQDAGAQLPSRVPTAAGCYAIVHDAWSSSLRGDSVFHRLPARVQLDTVAAAHGGWRLSPNIAYPTPAAFPGTPRWTIERDSVVLLWSNGFAPTRIAVAAGGPSMHGVAIALSDAISAAPTPHAAVRLDHVPCTH